MSEPVDLLLITWNRHAYVEKTLAQLLADPAEFRLHCWDNASQDGTADLIASLDDPRLARRHMSRENVGQREPSLWLLEGATGDLAGKIDDDILLPHGWLERLAPPVRREPRLGLLGCWVFMEEDWDGSLAAPNVIEIAGVRVLRLISRAGQSFVARREVMRRYLRPAGRGHGFPVDQGAMSLDGLVNGTLVPPIFAHNMDDPRSPHCLMRAGQAIGAHGALTARKRGFDTPEAYVEWIRRDARHKLCAPFSEELAREREKRDRSLLGRARRAWRRARGRHRG